MEVLIEFLLCLRKNYLGIHFVSQHCLLNRSEVNAQFGAIIHQHQIKPIRQPGHRLIANLKTQSTRATNVVVPEKKRSGEKIAIIDNFRGGQLANSILQWQKLGAPKKILKIISGYTIPFAAKPPLVPLYENLIKFNTKTSRAMTKELKNLLTSGVVEKCDVPTGFLSRMFLLPKTNGKVRQIFDLRRLNSFLSPPKFRLINQNHISNFLQKGDYLGKVDISQAYFHIPVKRSHRRFLAFAYEGNLYQMASLPFGLSSAPYAFSCLSKWVANFLRSKGFRVLVYLDDFLFANQDPQLLEGQIDYAVNLLQSLGWSVNSQKSVVKAIK